MRKIFSLLLIFLICNSAYAKPFNNTGNVGAQPISGGMNQENITGIRQNFTRDLFSGSAGYDYKLDFPAGPRGMDTDLHLTYNSYSRDTASIAGYGWNLGTSRIYRNARKGVDTLYTSNEFVADGNELIETPSGSGIYLSKNANNLNRYTFTSGKWLVEDTLGNKLVYGSMDISKLADPSNPNKVFAWMLDSITDPFGNRIEYNYIRDAGGNVLPKNIRYGFDRAGTPLYEIQFRLIDKTRSISSYRTQFELKTSKLLSEVALMVNGIEARKYVLSYDSVDSAYSHLIRIEERSGAEKLPSLDLSYGKGKDIHLLTKIDNNKGATISMSYTPSTGYKTDGKLANAKLPILLMTLSKIDYLDSITGQTSNETFEYAGGNYYYDSSDLFGREYAGFYQTTVTDDTLRKQISYFHQSQTSTDGNSLGEWQDHISKKGRTFREETYDGSGSLLMTKISKWTHIPKGNSRFLVNPKEITTLLTTTGTGHIDTAEGYEYDQYGNTTKKILYGLVNADPKTGAFTDTESDRRDVIMTYANNPEKNLYGFIQETSLLSGNGDIYAKNEKIYDTLSGGFLSSGLVNKEIFEKDGTGTISKSYTYTASGLLSTNADGNGNITQIFYDTYNLFPTSTKNPLGWGESMVPDYSVGKTKEVTNAVGTKTIIVFDGFGRVLGQSVQISGESPILVESHTYDTTVRPNKETITKYFTADGQDSKKTYVYSDGFGQAIESREESNATGSYNVSKIVYDTKGNKIFLSYPRSETGANYTPIGIDEAGDSFTYDGLDRISSRKNTTGEVKYRYSGLETTIINQKNIPTKFGYTAFGELEKVTENNGGNSYVTRYEYSPLGKLTKITDALGNTRALSYDRLGRTTKMEDLHGTGSIFGSIYFGYDNNGNLIEKKIQSGETITWNYDPLNRTIQEKYNSGSTDIITTMGYDTGLFGTGLLSKISKGDYEQSYTYNGLAQKSGETIQYGNDLYTFGYTYDIANELTNIIFPDNVTQNNIYKKGLPESVSFGGQPIISVMTYNPAGKPLRTEYANGIATDYLYDYQKGYRLVAKRSTKDAKQYQIIGYTFDNVGNIVELKEQGLPELRKTVSYSYDDLNRLSSASYTLSGTGNSFSESYTYDPIGNMLTGPAFATATYGSTTGANPHAITSADGTSYSYDIRGNLIGKTDAVKTSQYGFNLKNEMTSYTDGSGSTAYAYDSTGRRILKQGADGTTQYVNQFLEIEK